MRHLAAFAAAPILTVFALLGCQASPPPKPEPEATWDTMRGHACAKDVGKFFLHVDRNAIQRRIGERKISGAAKSAWAKLPKHRQNDASMKEETERAEKANEADVRKMFKTWETEIDRGEGGRLCAWKTTSVGSSYVEIQMVSATVAKLFFEERSGKQMLVDVQY